MTTFRFTASMSLLALAWSGAAFAKDAPKQPPPLQAGTIDSSGTYQLSAEEQAMDCKRLTGRIQIRILQMREMQPAAKPSGLSNDLRQQAAPITGLLLGKSSSYTNDPAKRQADDRAMLNAYNKQLAAKGCKTFNLDAELSQKPGGKELPRPAQPTAATPAKPAAPQAKPASN